MVAMMEGICASTSGTFATSLPPAVAMCGRPPPPPPSSFATAPTIRAGLQLLAGDQIIGDDADERDFVVVDRREHAHTAAESAPQRVADALQVVHCRRIHLPGDHLDAVHRRWRWRQGHRCMLPASATRDLLSSFLSSAAASFSLSSAA